MALLTSARKLIGGSLLAAVALTAGSAALPVEAEAAQFMSLYHRPDLKWYTIETEHFLVHYPVSKKGKEKNEHYVNGEWAARKVARVSEQYYGPMCKEFDYYLTEKTHIVLLEHSDELQGFTIPARNWVEISGNPGTDFYRLRGRSEWFANVLVHEFAHVVSLKRNQATAENNMGVAVTSLYANNHLMNNGGADLDLESSASIFISDRTEPWWWTEGGAEYWSTRSGYNWWTSARDRHLRNTVLEDRMLTYEEWKNRANHLTWGDGERGYQQGHSMALYLRQRFGDKAFAEFANEHDRGWRSNWETIIEEKTGVPGHQLYREWKAWVEEYYDEVYADIVAEGEVRGVDISAGRQPWDFRSPMERDAFFSKDKGKKKVRKRRREWEGQKDGSGRYEGWAKFSDDGQWFAESKLGSFSLSKKGERLFSARTAERGKRSENDRANRESGAMRMVVPTAWSTGYDFVPGKDQAVLTMMEDTLDRMQKPYYHIDVELDGYDMHTLAVVEFEPRTAKKKHRDDKAEMQTLRPKRSAGSGWMNNYRQNPRLKIREIPNTKRGSEPSVSPDGERVAYLEYADGTNNLVIIDLDGENKRYMTQFESGELLQSVDWSPDGKTIVLALFKNYQSDLWFMDVESGEVTPLNHDDTEELDVHWSKHDGNIYFSSDKKGIYNIYRYDTSTKKVAKLTNVVGSAYMPHLTPSGDLLYNNVTAFGNKNYMVAKDEFLETDVTDQFVLDFDPARAKLSWDYVEDLSEFEAVTTPYRKWKRFHPPAIVPILELSNPALPNFNFQGGFQMSSFDTGEKHQGLLVALAGQEKIVFGNYTYRGWYPELFIAAQFVESKNPFGFLLDGDDNPDTLDDQSIYEIKQNTQSIGVFGGAVYPINKQTQISVTAGAFQFAFRSAPDRGFVPFFRSASLRGELLWSSVGDGVDMGRVMWGTRGINPRGRVINLSYTHGWSDYLAPTDYGYTTDDGQRIDDYEYNTIEGRFTEHFSVPTFGIPLLEKARAKSHALQVDLQGGFIDRNVGVFDELRKGGGHPSYGGRNGAVYPNAALAGYPAVLIGERRLVGSLFYRFPIASRLSSKWGPFILRDFYVQAGGSAGNLWSFRPPEESEQGKYYYNNQGERIAYDPSDVKAEIPFVDGAYKNGGHPILADASIEIRMSSLLMSNQFNSMIRVSMPFTSVGGIWDVDGDDISNTLNAGFGNGLSPEVEKPGPRLQLSIGTGW